MFVKIPKTEAPHPILVKAVWRAHATGSAVTLTSTEASLVGFTLANFIYLITSALGTPYLYGGTEPFHGGADCSGLIYWACGLLGYACPRTTTGEWAGLPGSTNWKAAPYGSLMEYQVNGDGGSPPQHVGVVIGSNEMIDDPETGEDVSVQPIPYNAAIFPIGYRTLPFQAAPAPGPSPAPTPTEVDVDLVVEDPKTGGNWVTDENGALYVWGAAPFVAGLNQHPQYDAGSAESGGANPCVGIAYWAAFGVDGIVFYTKPSSGKGGWSGTPYDQYFFNRAGQVAAIDHEAGVVNISEALPRTQPVTAAAPLAEAA